MTCKSVYKAVWINKPIDPFATAIWKNYSPNKCRIFLWLASKNRLFTNERRFNRGISDSNCCPFCPASESASRLFLQCPDLRPLWQELSSLSASVPSDFQHLLVMDLANRPRSTVIIAILWNIWKRRNAKVFRQDLQPIHLIARSAADDLMLWSNRCSNEQAVNLLRDWCTMLFHLSMRL